MSPAGPHTVPALMTGRLRDRPAVRLRAGAARITYLDATPALRRCASTRPRTALTCGVNPRGARRSILAHAAVSSVPVSTNQAPRHGRLRLQEGPAALARSLTVTSRAAIPLHTGVGLTNCETRTVIRGTGHRRLDARLTSSARPLRSDCAAAGAGGVRQGTRRAGRSDGDVVEPDSSAGGSYSGPS